MRKITFLDNTNAKSHINYQFSQSRTYKPKLINKLAFVNLKETLIKKNLNKK